MSNPQAKQADFSALKALWNHADRLDAAGFEVHAENSTPCSVESYSAAVYLSSVSRPFLAGQKSGRTLPGTKIKSQRWASSLPYYHISCAIWKISGYISLENPATQYQVGGRTNTGKCTGKLRLENEKLPPQSRLRVPRVLLTERHPISALLLFLHSFSFSSYSVGNIGIASRWVCRAVRLSYGKRTSLLL